jgi:hypothetical protein
MKNLSIAAKAYILGMILAGLALTGWMAQALNWMNPWLYVVAVFGAVAQTLKLEGPNARTNYSVAWFVYGFAFVAFGPAAAIFVVVVSHLVEWSWHKYPWYIQSFNIGNHVLAVFVAGLVFGLLDHGAEAMNVSGAFALIAANLVFVLGNHFLVGMVIKLARGQSFAESGVFGFLTVFLDFCVLSMGTITALVSRTNPFAAVLNVLPLYLLYNALRVPALQRQVREMQQVRGPVEAVAAGD